jgi:endo-1,4-beta-xylanase
MTHESFSQVHLNAVTISVNGFNTTWSQQRKFKAQATWYALLLQACLDSPACVDFEPFGLTDRYDMGSTPIYSLPFDSDYNPKPAFWAMLGVLNGTINGSNFDPV